MKPAQRRPAGPYQARDELRGLLLVAAVAAVPERQPVVVADPGPHGAGGLCDGATVTVTSRIRVEIGEAADTTPQTRMLAVRRHLTAEGWAVVRSGTTGALAELVAVRAGYTMTVSKSGAERRVVLTGETPPMPA